MLVHKNPTPEQIIAYCDDLKKALLNTSERKHPIKIEVKPDISTKDDLDEYGNQPIDHVYLGYTITIKMGRPANE